VLSVIISLGLFILIAGAHCTQVIAVKQLQLQKEIIDHNSDTSCQNCGRHEISIPLDCLTVKDYLLSNCDYCSAIDLVRQAPDPRLD